MKPGPVREKATLVPIRNPHSAIRHPTGLTLVEVLVTITIFVFLALMMLMLVRQTVESWTKTERNRILYERAAGTLDRMSDDISLVAGADPPRVDQVLSKFIGDVDPSTGYPRLMFVRTFEAGPERALTLRAGEGEPSNLAYQAPSDDDRKAPPKPAAASPTPFDGKHVGDFQALGGLAMVGYFVQDQTLYRVIRSPVTAGMNFQGLLTPDEATPVVEDVLFFDLGYWSQVSTTWEPQKPNSTVRGPERIWDSTRGYAQEPLSRFILHRDPISLNDPTDDVFPEKVRITLTVDSPMPRCLFTKLEEEAGAGDGRIAVNSTKGFPAGGEPDSLILIDKEWIRYKEKKDDAFIVEAGGRGVRGTFPGNHGPNAVVRAGKTFYRTVQVRNYRDDWSSDREYMLRKAAKKP
jgi:type II secretory pathway component PulJ